MTGIGKKCFHWTTEKLMSNNDTRANVVTIYREKRQASKASWKPQTEIEEKKETMVTVDNRQSATTNGYHRIGDRNKLGKFSKSSYSQNVRIKLGNQ